jgi:hypothetical protein
MRADMIQKKVANLFPIDYPFESLVARIQKGTLRLNPEFQRKYKWDIDGFERCSKFIESCLMRIPLPPCYLAEEEDASGEDILDVIDGVQRLTTIDRFFKNEFALEGLTVFEELNGKRFKELGKLRSELETTTIRCIVLRKENPRSIVQEIFARLNKGAVELSAQEIRHALFPGLFDDLLVDLAKTSEIANFKVSKQSTGNDSARNDSREAEELVLRYFAFNDIEKYENNALKWMDAYMEKNAGANQGEVAMLKQKFLRALKNCVEVFGDEVFCNLANRSKRQSYAVYDVQMHCLGRLSHDVVLSHRIEIFNCFKDLCTSKDFLSTLRVRLSGKTNIQSRRDMFIKALHDINLVVSDD